MTNGAIRIETEEEWRALAIDRQTWLLFQTMNTNNDLMDRRVKKLEKRKWFDTTVSGLTGLIGGFFAFLFCGPKKGF